MAAQTILAARPKKQAGGFYFILFLTAVHPKKCQRAQHGNFWLYSLFHEKKISKLVDIQVKYYCRRSESTYLQDSKRASCWCILEKNTTDISKIKHFLNMEMIIKRFILILLIDIYSEPVRPRPAQPKHSLNTDISVTA